MSKQITVCFALAGASLVSATAIADDFGKGCEAHYKTEGSFLTGKKFSTWAEYANTSKAEAYTRIYANLAKDGWNIVNADKDAGIISVSQAVSFGKGATAPLTIVIESAGSGSKATASFRTSGGQLTSGDTLRTKLCAYLDASTPK